MYEFELGGFAEELSDIDGTIEEFNAFNYCLAESYVGAMYDEDFESLGEFSPSLLNNICAWYNYDESMKNQEETNEIKTGKLITKNNRTFIDANMQIRALPWQKHTYLMVFFLLNLYLLLF